MFHSLLRIERLLEFEFTRCCFAGSVCVCGPGDGSEGLRGMWALESGGREETQVSKTAAVVGRTAGVHSLRLLAGAEE